MQSARSRSFGSVARAYDRARASYPGEAVAWVLSPAGAAAGLRVVDLGAGTGRLSAVLLGMGADVVAVEPDDAMRALVPAGA
ncbi:MAG: SAM-dependent methyltransferase, partial [Actinomycetota bacterium]